MARKLKPGVPAPDFRLARADGGELGPAEMRGRPWLLSFHRYAT